MKPRRFTRFIVLVCAALVLTALSGATAPIAAQEPQPPSPGSSLVDTPLPPGEGPYRVQDGTWHMRAQPGPSLTSSASTVPNATGGPDDFGYTWDDSVALDWIDATGGIVTGLSGYSGGQSVGPIVLPFAFQFYENTYTELYIAASGYLAFTDQTPWPTQSAIPSPTSPNNVVAPYWTPLNLSGEGETNRVYYVSGGVTPNRYFVVEWHGVEYDDDLYTFEVVLYENGDILFQYQAMTYNGNYLCGAGGIENSRGWDGLSYVDFCRQASSYRAVRFYRPAPSARVGVWPLYQGRLIAPGETVSFRVPVRNTGELGSDTYDLFVSSAWPVSLYAADGTTSLIDTDGDGTADTGSVAQGDTVTITIKVSTPVTAALGDWNAAAITIRSSLSTSKSKSPILQTAVPAPFAQVYEDDADGAMSLYLVQPTAQAVKKATPDEYYADDLAVAEMADGFACFWTKDDGTSSVGTTEIEYTLLDRYGQAMRGPSGLTDHSGATISTRDYDPAVAVAPNGRVGVVWYRSLYNSSTGTWNYNVFLAILESSGNLSYGPISLTSNSIWGSSYDDGVPWFNKPRIAATEDNRFVMAWRRVQRESAGWLEDVYYAVRDTNGGAVKDVTKFTSGVADDGQDYVPALTALSGSRALLAYEGPNGISYAVLDSAGNTLKGETGTGGYGYLPDAVQLYNDNVLLAWMDSGADATDINFVVLGGTTYDVVAGPTTLQNPAAPIGDGYVSVTAGGSDHGVLTTMDQHYGYRVNLYYTLVDDSGNVVTDPMIFGTSQAAEPSISASYEGHGNTSYSWTPPSDADGVAAFSASTFRAPPGGSAAVHLRYANHGTEMATGVVLTATLDSSLSYVADTSGVTPNVSAKDVVWNLPSLGFLDSESFTLYLQVPSDPAIGSRYPVTLTLASQGPEANPSDNTDTTEVTTFRQVFLPVVLRSQ